MDEAIISGLSYQEVMPSQGIVELNGKLLKRGIQTTKESAIMTELWQQKQLAKQYLYKIEKAETDGRDRPKDDIRIISMKILK